MKNSDRAPSGEEGLNLGSWLLFSNFQKDLFQENLYISVAFHKGIEVHQQLTRVNLLYKIHEINLELILLNIILSSPASSSFGATEDLYFIWKWNESFVEE